MSKEWEEAVGGGWKKLAGRKTERNGRKNEKEEG